VGVLESFRKESHNDTRSRKVNFKFEFAGFSNRLRIAHEPAAAQMDRGESERYIWKRSKRSAANKHARIETGHGYLEPRCLA
jgi:hypothetical protein